MKRSRELQPLSRDHHQALYAALTLRRASPENAYQASAAFLGFWREHGQRHFQIEEEILLPEFVARGGNPRDERVASVLMDHVEIRARVRRLSAETPVAELHRLGENLGAHVRFEEDQLFRLIEDELEPDALAALGEELARAERGRS